MKIYLLCLQEKEEDSWENMRGTMMDVKLAQGSNGDGMKFRRRSVNAAISRRDETSESVKREMAPSSSGVRIRSAKDAPQTSSATRSKGK